MTNSQRLATVRARLKSWLANHPPESTSHAKQGEAAGSDSNHPILRETILIRDEFYCGRRFYMPAHHAVWFIEEDQLKIYRNDGGLVCTLSGAEIDQADQTAKAEPSDEPADVIKLPLPNRNDQQDGGEIRRAA